MRAHMQRATTAAQDKASEASVEDLSAAKARLEAALLHVGCDPTKFGRADSVAHEFHPPWSDVWVAWKALHDLLDGKQ